MQKFLLWVLVPAVLLAATPLWAEVVTDGTTGGAGAVSLRGPDYDIRPEYGDLAGANLFHSFQQFNIDTGESAVFSGPSSVDNIISRVTGGSLSTIDGLLRSTIPGAALYLVNPAGILFGPDAALDVDGAFHASTADYLRMGDAERWYSLPVAGESFSSAPPSAFGFLGGEAASITVDGSSLESLGNAVSLVGGDLIVENNAQITIDGGRLDMAAVASAGEAVPGPDGLDTSSFGSMADIEISGNDQGRPSGISVSTGSIFIRGGRFVVDNSELIADTPFSTDIQPTGVIDIQAERVALKNGALLSTDTFGRANGADIRIEARESVDASGAVIRVGSFGVQASGDAGELSVAARDIDLGGGTLIQSESREQSTGNAGNVSLHADNGVAIADAQINTFTTGTGDAGNVAISGDEVHLDTGADIRAFTRGSGAAGKVSIAAGRLIHLAGDAAVRTETEASGPGGLIELAAEEVLLEAAAVVSSSSLASNLSATRDSGAAGTIRVAASGRVVVKDDAAIRTETLGGAPAGDIAVQAGQFEMDGGAALSSDSTAESGGGDAGAISVVADDTVQLTGGAALTTEAVSGGGGRISVGAGTGVYLLDSGISTSVKMGQGDGGDIRIGDVGSAGTPKYVVLNRSTVTANADEGDGGAIFITTENYFQSADSVVEATSQRGNDGTIQITAPYLDLIGGLTVLPSNYLDASRWVKNPCAVQPAARMSRFVHREARDGMPQSFDDWLPSGPVLIPRCLERRGESIDDDCAALLHRGDFAGVVERLSGKTRDPLHAAAAARAFAALGHYRGALAALFDAEPAVEDGADDALQALFLNAMADLYLCLGNRMGAIEYQKRALAAAERSRDPRMVAGAYNQLGNVRAAGDSLDAAASAYDRGLASLAGLPAVENLKAVLLMNKARARIAAGRGPEALALLGRAEALLPPDAGTYTAAASWISLAMLREQLAGSLDQGGTAPAASAYTRAMAAGRDLGNDRILSTALGRQGRLDAVEGRYDAALRHTRAAIMSAEAGYYPELLYRWHWQMGRLSRAMAAHEAAIFWYRSAIDVLNPIRWEYFNGTRDRKKTFDDHVRPVYIELADLLLADDARIEEAWETMERLKAVELQDYFQDECVASRIPAGELSAERIPERTGLIYPIALEADLVLLMRFSDRAEQVRVPVPAVRVREVCRRFRESLEILDDGFMADARTLYDWLIRPIEGALTARGIDTLVIVPDGPLRLIPFSTLHDGRRYLIERYAVGVVPALRLTDVGADDGDAGGSPQALLNGLSGEAGGFAPLAYVPGELSGIQSLLGGKILLDEAFTRSALAAELKQHAYDIVHMATHAVFGNNADESFLMTYDGRLTMNQLDALIRIGEVLGQQVDLLTLSACETALGDERSAFGLAGVALKAGARSALATLWETDDEASSLLVQEFYRHLASPDATKASALQRAQRKVMAEPQFSHPGIWAPFLVIGDWL
mgnify:CR=1 FL=1